MIPRFRTCCAVLAPAVFVVALATPVQAQLVFAAVPTPVGGGSQALGISANGETVVGFTELGPTQAYRWDWRGGGPRVDLGPGNSKAWAVSANGSVVVGEEGEEGLRWVGAVAPVGTVLGSLNGTPVDVVARGVSADGLIIVGESNSANGREAFLWSGGSMQALSDLDNGNFASVANGISGDGSVVVGKGHDGRPRAVVFDIVSPIDDPTALDSSTADSLAWAISGDGDVVVGSLGAGTTLRAYRSSTTPGSMVLLDNTIRAESLAVSDDGSVIVGRMIVSGSSEAFIWDATNGMRNLETIAATAGLDLSNIAGGAWQLRRAFGVSADGRVIVGYGDFVPSGGDPDNPFQRAFILDLGPTAVPEPSAALLLLPCIGWLAWRRMRPPRGPRR